MKKIISLIMILFFICMDVMFGVYSYTAEGYNTSEYRSLGWIAIVFITISLPVICKSIEKLKD